MLKTNWKTTIHIWRDWQDLKHTISFHVYMYTRRIVEPKQYQNSVRCPRGSGFLVAARTTPSLTYVSCTANRSATARPSFHGKLSKLRECSKRRIPEIGECSGSHHVRQSAEYANHSLYGSVSVYVCAAGVHWLSEESRRFWLRKRRKRNFLWRLFYCGKGKLLYSYHRMFNEIILYLQYYKVIRIVQLYKTGLLQLQITKISLEETTTTKTFCITIVYDL